MTAIQLKAESNKFSSSFFFEMIKMNNLPMSAEFKNTLKVEIRKVIGSGKCNASLKTLIIRVFNGRSFCKLGHLYINSIKTDAKALAALETIMAGTKGGCR